MKGVKVSDKRMSRVDFLARLKGYKKHIHGIKYTRVFFKDGVHFKVDECGLLRAFK